MPIQTIRYLCLIVGLASLYLLWNLVRRSVINREWSSSSILIVATAFLPNLTSSAASLLGGKSVASAPAGT